MLGRIDAIDWSAAESIRIGLAQAAYDKGNVRFKGIDITGYDYIVASRQGLFAACETAYLPIAHGQFFGITIRDGAIYAFEACDRVHAPTYRGRLIRLDIAGNRIASADVVAAGLDNGCHQIDFIDGCLCVVDTYNQRIQRFSPDFADSEFLYPLVAAAANDWHGGYAHINALLQVGDEILLMLHNGGKRTEAKSAIAVLDRQWQMIDRWRLQGRGCHNIAVLENGDVLCCGSLAGELITLDGTAKRVTSKMTRGLCVDARSIVIGASLFVVREERGWAPGSVHFLDRSFRQRAMLDLPAAPTEIRRLDGDDGSLSSFVRKTNRTVRRRTAEAVA